jgi:hypothetical protein
MFGFLLLILECCGLRVPRRTLSGNVTVTEFGNNKHKKQQIATGLLSVNPYKTQAKNSSMTQLTEQFHLPEQYNKACQRLDTLVARHAQRLLEQEYWSPEHLENIQEHAGQSYTYIRDDQTDMFEDTEEYLYSRFKRCIYARVAQTLDAHTDEYNAYQFVTNTVREEFCYLLLNIRRSDSLV